MHNTKTDFKLKHPSSLWWLSAVYALFMCTFGDLISVITLYLNQSLAVSQQQAYLIFAAFSSLMWTLPLPGGYLSSKFGYKYAASVGLLFCLFGTILLVKHSLLLTYFGLAAFVVGNGLFTPALWCLVDHAYKKEDPRREAGFTLFYLLFNVGAVSGIFLGGYLVKQFGYQTGFTVNVCFVLAALLCFLTTAKTLVLETTRSVAPQLPFRKTSLAFILFSICILATPATLLLYKYVKWNDYLLYAISIIVALAILRLANKQPTALAKFKVYGFFILTLFAVGFWALYNLEPSLLSVFIDHNVNRHLGNLSLPASCFFAFEGVFIIVLGLVMSKFWLYLSSKEKEVSLPVKFSLSLVFIGVGYLFLNLILHVVGYGHKIPMLLMISVYAFFSTAELLIGPLGISMVGKLSPQGSEGFLMGIWQLYMGLAAIFGGWLATFAVVPKNANLTITNNIYAHLFSHVGLSAVFIGVIMLFFAPLLKRLMV